MQTPIEPLSPLGEDPALSILMRKLEDAKARNSKISLRAFSQKIGLSSGALSEILKGQRPLSPAVKKRIADKLMLSPQEEMAFFQSSLPQSLSASEDHRLTLNQDQFHLIADWWYFAILNLLNTRGFKNNIAWMSRRLGLKIAVVKDSVDRLLRLGYVASEKNRLVRKVPHLKTSDKMRDLSARKSHLEDLKLIEASLLDVPPELRDNFSTTFVIDRKDLPRARELIRIFQSRFLSQVSHEQGEEVYKISIALYPLTKVSGDQ